ncbi:MAG: PASTA domain-containing protein [Mycobacteriales bacterium]
MSAGPTPFEMLDVTGQDLPTAQASVIRSGMRVAVQRSASDTVPPGMVIGTQPAAASVVHRGAHAVLTVSTGPAPVAVPDVRTMTIPEAESMLEAQGFTVQVHQLWGWAAP